MHELSPNTKKQVAEPVADTGIARQPSRWRSVWKFPKSWKEVKALGWKFIAAFILFYLIRDTILYIVIPYLVYKGIIGG